MAKKRLVWRREPRATGLRAVTQGTRGYDLRRGSVNLASVRPLFGEDRWTVVGWYFHARVGDDFVNTCDSPIESAEEAKRLAREWVVDRGA